jgi:hypothetical protein
MVDYIQKPPHEDDLRIERLRECLSYNSRTGVLRWKIRTRNTVPGAVAGYVDWRGYRYIRIDRQLLLAHRIAWAMRHGDWPAGDLDHINRNKGDNRIANLRQASRALNVANSPARNRSGVKGVYQLKGRNQWYSRINTGGEDKWLGSFSTMKAAASAFKREHQAVYGGGTHG